MVRVTGSARASRFLGMGPRGPESHGLVLWFDSPFDRSTESRTPKSGLLRSRELNSRFDSGAPHRERSTPPRSAPRATEFPDIAKIPAVAKIPDVTETPDVANSSVPPFLRSPRAETPRARNSPSDESSNAFSVRELPRRSRAHRISSVISITQGLPSLGWLRSSSSLLSRTPCSRVSFVRLTSPPPNTGAGSEGRDPFLDPSEFAQIFFLPKSSVAMRTFVRYGHSPKGTAPP